MSISSRSISQSSPQESSNSSSSRRSSRRYRTKCSRKYGRNRRSRSERCYSDYSSKTSSEKSSDNHRKYYHQRRKKRSASSSRKNSYVSRSNRYDRYSHDRDKRRPHHRSDERQRKTYYSPDKYSTRSNDNKYYRENHYSNRRYENRYPASKYSYDRCADSRRKRRYYRTDSRNLKKSSYDHFYRSHRPSRWRRTHYNESKKQKSYHSTPHHSKSRAKDEEDENRHFEWFSGMHLSHHYIVRSQLGEGTFGRVLECEDLRNGNTVAIKVVRDVSRYTSSAKIEADILDKVKEKDSREQSNCLSLIDRFFYDSNRGRSCSPNSATVNRKSNSSLSRSSSYSKGIHMCLVSERLGLSLYAFLCENEFRGFFMEDLQFIAKEILIALSFLKSIKLTHTDLKPENILFVNHASEYVEFPRMSFAHKYRQSKSLSPSPSPKRTRRRRRNMTKRPFSCSLKLIDFGSATFEDDHHSSLINTRQYRAPEVILQTGWSMPSDMWSFGCILMELYTGVLLFQTHKHLEHLAMIEKIIEPFSQKMLQKCASGSASKYVCQSKKGTYFLNWPQGADSTHSERRVARCVPLEKLVHPNHVKFAEFVRFLLRVDPDERPTPDEALQHPFFKIKFIE